MLIAFPPETLRRLSQIESAEGISPVEIIHQAVDIWSRLDADGRRVLGITAMTLVVEKMRGGRL